MGVLAVICPIEVKVNVTIQTKQPHFTNMLGAVSMICKANNLVNSDGKITLYKHNLK